MKAILLAAGRGSRLGSHTLHEPKCRTMLLGKRLIDRQLEAFREASIRDIAIVRGYMAGRIQVAGATYFENGEWERTNMLASLRCASEWLEREPCIVSYTDIVYNSDVIELMLGADEEDDIVIPYNINWLPLWEARFQNPLSDAETFRLGSDSRVIEIGGRPTTLQEVEGQFMGLLRISPKGWQMIQQFLSIQDQRLVERMDLTALLAGLIEQGVAIKAIPYHGLWLEVDHESDLLLYEDKYGDRL